jgi:hypothetical protein
MQLVHGKLDDELGETVMESARPELDYEPFVRMRLTTSLERQWRVSCRASCS